jgi:hypothetical protein
VLKSDLDPQAVAIRGNLFRFSAGDLAQRGLGNILFKSNDAIKGTDPKNDAIKGNQPYVEPNGSIPWRLGVPLREAVIFGPLVYKDRNGQDVNLPKINIGDAMVTIGLSNTLVRTLPVSGSNTVQEFIANDDYAVTIDLHLWEDLVNRPYDQVTLVNNYLRAPVPIPVISKWFETFNIFYIIAEGAQFAMVEGSVSQVPVSINGYSSRNVDILDLNTP